MVAKAKKAKAIPEPVLDRESDAKIRDATGLGYGEWIARIQSETKFRSRWRNDMQAIERVYENQLTPPTSGNPYTQLSVDNYDYNIMWSNCQILLAALYSQNPRPDVRKRYAAKADELSKSISMVTERALSYMEDNSEWYWQARDTVLAMIKSGLGIWRARYVPYIVDTDDTRKEDVQVIGDDDSGKQFTRADGSIIEPADLEKVSMVDGRYVYDTGEAGEELAHEEVVWEYIPPSRFHWEPCQHWGMVRWCAIDHYLTRDQVADQMGESVADQLQYCYADDGSKMTGQAGGQYTSSIQGGQTGRALVYEIFDKRNRKVVMLPAHSGGVGAVVVDDPLGLEEFYPFPRPMMATMSVTDLSPIADYMYYRDQHEELNVITFRINKLLRSLKYRGVYDGSLKQMPDLAALEDGDFKGVDQFAMLFAQSGSSMNDFVKALPLDEGLSLLNQLYQAREQVKSVIFEITGIADIVRGDTKASETLGAQQLKAQFANIRLQNKTTEVERFMRDSFRITAEIIGEHFEPQTLTAMTGVEVTPEMMSVLSDDLLRSYAIDVESESTSIQDSQQAQKDRTEMVAAIAQTIQTVAPMVQSGDPAMIKFSGELLAWVVSGFKGARDMQQSVDEMVAHMTGQGTQASMPGAGNPHDGMQMPPETGLPPGVVPFQGVSR